MWADGKINHEALRKRAVLPEKIFELLFWIYIKIETDIGYYENVVIFKGEGNQTLSGKKEKKLNKLNSLLECCL